MILIVDDAKEIIDWLVEVIITEGYYADYALDSIPAIFKLRRIPYAMALIDIRLPTLDGNEVARRVKEMPEPYCNIPLVAMTGSRLTANENLFNATIEKPFRPSDLRELIHQNARPPIEDLHVPPTGGG